MGKIIRDATPEQEKDFVEERRQFAFLAACTWPSSWLSAAERHKRAADILYGIAHDANEREAARATRQIRDRVKRGIAGSESRLLKGEELCDFLDSQLFSDYLLLAGYALECVLKGLLLTKKPDLLQGDKELDTSITTHNLAQLCDSCAITLSKKEQQVIDVMTWQIQ